jgi:hemerythrin superfamily protein
MFQRPNEEIEMANTSNQDATHLLMADHRKVEELFEQFENASGDGRKERIAKQICVELKVHTAIEEEIFYPALRGKISDDDLDEAYVEHDGAKVLINEIEAGGPDEDYYDAKVKVLQEQIEHHVEEEEKERGNIFQQARATDVDLVALGERMAARKAELMAMAEAGGLPPAQPATFEHAGA